MLPICKLAWWRKYWWGVLLLSMVSGWPTWAGHVFWDCFGPPISHGLRSLSMRLDDWCPINDFAVATADEARAYFRMALADPIPSGVSDIRAAQPAQMQDWFVVFRFHASERVIQRLVDQLEPVAVEEQDRFFRGSYLRLRGKSIGLEWWNPSEVNNPDCYESHRFVTPEGRQAGLYLLVDRDQDLVYVDACVD